MEISSLGWERQPQEITNPNHWFDGEINITNRIESELSKEEIHSIVADAKNLAMQNKGIGYLIVYNHNQSNRKLFFADYGSHATLMFAQEY